MRTIEVDNTEAVSSVGLGNSSAEASVMEVERSAGVICLSVIDNCQSRSVSHGWRRVHMRLRWRKPYESRDSRTV
jgi:hypothetical protein